MNIIINFGKGTERKQMQRHKKLQSNQWQKFGDSHIEIDILFFRAY